MTSARSGRERWLALAERVEAALLRAAVVGLLLLLVGQGLLATDARSWLSYVYRLEGIAYDPLAMVKPEAVGALYLSPEPDPVPTLTLLVVDRPSAAGLRLLVNGHPVADFAHPQMTVPVRDGDRLDLDGRGVRGSLRVRVVDAAPGVRWPPEGLEVAVRGDVRPLGRVDVR